MGIPCIYCLCIFLVLKLEGFLDRVAMSGFFPPFPGVVWRPQP